MSTPKFIWWDIPVRVRVLYNTAHPYFQVALMTNGSAATGQRLVERAGVQDVVELVLDAEEAAAWKPARGAYLYCCHRLQLEPSRVNTHPTVVRRSQWPVRLR